MDMTPRYRRRGRLITAASLVVVGLIWIGQGFGLFGASSFMFGEWFWAAVGGVFVVAGSILGLMAWRNPPES